MGLLAWDKVADAAFPLQTQSSGSGQGWYHRSSVAAGSSECTEELLGQGNHPSAPNFQTVIPRPDALFQYDRNVS